MITGENPDAASTKLVPVGELIANVLALDLSSKSLNYFGSVYNGNTGQTVNGFNIVALDRDAMFRIPARNIAIRITDNIFLLPRILS